MAQTYRLMLEIKSDDPDGGYSPDREVYTFENKFDAIDMMVLLGNLANILRDEYYSQ